MFGASFNVDVKTLVGDDALVHEVAEKTIQAYDLDHLTQATYTDDGTERQVRQRKRERKRQKVILIVDDDDDSLEGDAATDLCLFCLSPPTSSLLAATVSWAVG